jgi:hypothetical protein
VVTSRLRALRRPTSRITSGVGIISTLALLGACGVVRGTGQDRSELLSQTASPRIDCTPEPVPEVLPSVGALLDSAAVARAVRELRGSNGPRDGYVLLSLGFDRDGINIRRDLVEHSVTPSLADSVQRVVFAARRELDATEAEWGVRLRIDLAAEPVMQVGRREFCPPVARDRELDAAMHGLNPAGVRYRRGRRERVVHMRALITESGTVGSAYILRGEARGSSLERELALFLRQFLFTPASVDGIPTRAWVEIPMRIPA